MNFTYPNFYFTDCGFWIRWTLIAFLFINVLLAFFLIKSLKAKSIKLSFNVRKSFLPALIYLSTIPIYIFRDIVGTNGESAIYKISEYLNSIESLVATVLFISLIYGFTYKNSYTFINLYCKVLSVIEITYIISCSITNQFKLDQWFNLLGGILLGVVFVVLSKIKIESARVNIPNRNIHDAVDRYDTLFSARKYQAKELINIIESNISESGYSVCVTGEWGKGKTSLINGVLDKIKQNKSVNLYEIRINTLELDDNESLIKYFFIKVEDILKTNEIYVGIASEYRELIASISGTIISENVTDFVSKKLNSGGSDYRENIEKLSKLLYENLRDSRILIIIDDIERCSSEKAKSYLFLLKEIATMNCCITLFLADIDKLVETCDLDESFFEKFFNHIISLSSVGVDEIILSICKISKEASDLGQEIKRMLIKFDSEIEKSEKEPLLYIKNYKEREDTRERRINSIKETKVRFLNDLSNPRRINKAVEYYEILSQQIKQQKDNCTSEIREVLDLFLSKVDYKKQLSLISIIYGLYNGEFISLQTNIYDYIDNFVARCSAAKSQEEKIYRVDSLIDNDWCVLRKYRSDFRIQETLRFVNCVLTDVDELANISNGYNSFEEQQISIVKNGNLPNDISFPDLISMIYTATYNKLSERVMLIKNVFDLYAKGMNTGSVDSSFELFSNNVATNIFSNETPVIRMFAEIFCTDNCHLANPKLIKKRFISFANGYLWRNLTIFSRYFLPISSPERVSYEAWNNASEKALSRGNCEDMLNAYCELCESYLDFSNEIFDIGAISRLRSIIDKVTTKYSELEMAECIYVLDARKTIAELMDEITYIFKIEHFINKCSVVVEQNSFNIRGLSSDTLSIAIERLSSELSESIEYDRNSDIQGLLQFVCGNEGSITLDDYKKLNHIVENFSKENNPVASWIQMLIYIKKHKVQVQNAIDDTGSE